MMTGMNGMMVMIAKGNSVTVRGPAGNPVSATVVDSDQTAVWIRLPTNTVVKMQQRVRGSILEGRVGSLDLTLDLSEN
jgi:hypothetical protein